MGKIPQLPNVHAGQDGRHSVFGPHPEGGLPVPLLSPRRLRTSGHHHRCQVGFVDLLIIIDQVLPHFLKTLLNIPHHITVPNSGALKELREMTNL